MEENPYRSCSPYHYLPDMIPGCTGWRSSESLFPTGPDKETRLWLHWNVALLARQKLGFAAPAWQGGLSDHAGSGRTPPSFCTLQRCTFCLLVMRLWSVTYPHQSVPDDFRDIHYYARLVQRAHGARCHLLGWACDFALTSLCPQVPPYQARCASQEGEPLIDYFLLPGWMALIGC